MPTYIRCRDDCTGHEFDVDERSLRAGLTPIAGYPPNSGPGARPRPAKHRVAKDGKPARPRRAAKATAKSAPNQPEGAQPS
jgi:hypothetical protein